jgi:hypothetical protein
MLPVVLKSLGIPSSAAIQPGLTYHDERNQGAKYHIMHIYLRRQLAGPVTFLVVLCMLAAFNIFTPTASHATAKLYRKPTKDTLQFLPQKLKSPADTPARTISIYESTTNAATLQKQGCQAAHQVPGLIILDWGQPVYFGNNIYGTYDFGGNDDTDTAIMHAVSNFAQGVWNCHVSSTNIALGIGESNYFSDHALPLTTAAWYADGHAGQHRAKLPQQQSL